MALEPSGNLNMPASQQLAHIKVSVQRGIKNSLHSPPLAPDVTAVSSSI